MQSSSASARVAVELLCRALSHFGVRFPTSDETPAWRTGPELLRRAKHASPSSPLSPLEMDWLWTIVHDTALLCLRMKSGSHRVCDHHLDVRALERLAPSPADAVPMGGVKSPSVDGVASTRTGSTALQPQQRRIRLVVMHAMRRWGYGRALFYVACCRAKKEEDAATETGLSDGQCARELVLSLSWMVHRFDLLPRYIRSVSVALLDVHFDVCHVAVDAQCGSVGRNTKPLDDVCIVGGKLEENVAHAVSLHWQRRSRFAKCAQLVASKESERRQCAVDAMHALSPSQQPSQMSLLLAPLYELPLIAPPRWDVADDMDWFVHYLTSVGPRLRLLIEDMQLLPRARTALVEWMSSVHFESRKEGAPSSLLDLVSGEGEGECSETTLKEELVRGDMRVTHNAVEESHDLFRLLRERWKALRLRLSGAQYRSLRTQLSSQPLHQLESLHPTIACLPHARLLRTKKVVRDDTPLPVHSSPLAILPPISKLLLLTSDANKTPAVGSDEEEAWLNNLEASHSRLRDACHSQTQHRMQVLHEWVLEWAHTNGLRMSSHVQV